MDSNIKALIVKKFKDAEMDLDAAVIGLMKRSWPDFAGRVPG